MYAVVGCSECSALWVIEGRPETTQCPRCGSRRKFELRRKFVETEDADAAREVRASMLAERQDLGEAFDGLDSYAEMEARVEEDVIDDDTSLESKGVDSDAAAAAGASRWWVVRHHVIPNVSGTVITAATLAVPTFVLGEATLAFLGFTDPDVFSWGRTIAAGRGDLATAWWVSTVPGVFLFLTVMAFFFVGDALNDAMDPRRER